MILLSLAGTRLVEAAPATDVEGYVLTMDSGDVVIDVGKARGAAVGDVVELWRPLKLKHPVTGKMVSDRFRIGTLRLVQVRDQLSLAQPDGALARPVAAGDVVVLRGTTPLLAPPVAPSTSTSAPAPAPGPMLQADPEADALAALFESLRGATIEKRIAAYKAFVKNNPTSRFRKTLEEEAAALQALLANAGAPKPSELPPAALSFDAPKEVIEGSTITIAIEIGGEITGAVLQLKGPDETAYTPFPMKSAGPRYFRITLPKERVHAPGITYFIEAVLPNGATHPVEGNAAAPRTAKVETAPKPAAPPKWLSTAAIWSDYSDYNRLRHNDWAWQTEGFFGMRFGDVGLRAVRSGFGVFKGEGGSVDELDVQGKSPRSVGLTYGYVEGEWGFLPNFGLAARAIVGLEEPDKPGGSGVTGGAQGFVRIGNDRKTNLLIGGEFLGGVGLRGITQFELKVFPRFPILFRSEVTNQPAGSAPSRIKTEQLGKDIAIGSSDLGVRAILQLGWRAIPSPAEGGKGAVGMTFFVRGSYQGRTINHAGPGVGAGAQVEW
ncbi:MAG: hypothetical protein ACXWUG_02455 [Polyangiales bacterium]